MLITLNGVGVTGQSPSVAVQRKSDGAYWTGSSFTGSFVAQPMTEVDAVNEPGLYKATFDQSIDNTEQMYTAYYENTGATAGSAAEEFFFTPTVPQAFNPITLAQVVASKILLNPSILIDSSNIAKETTLQTVLSDVTNIQNTMALQSTLLALANNFNTFATTVLGILQPQTGSNQVTFNVLDQLSQPIPGVAVTLKNTLGTITLAYGVTDINGQLILGLPAGTFNVLFFKPFVNIPGQPLVLVVTTNQTVNVSATTFQPVPPASNTCAVYGYTLDAQGQPAVGVAVRAKVVQNLPYSPVATQMLAKDWAETVSDGSGYFQLNLVIGAMYEISIPDLFFGLTNFIIPNQPNLDLSTQINATS